MDNMLAIPPTSTASGQEFHRSVKPGQQERSCSRWLNASPAPALADRHVGTDWTDATDDSVWLFLSEKGESPTHVLAPMLVEASRLSKEVTWGSNQPPRTATGTETRGKLQTLHAKWMAGVFDGDAFFSFGCAEPAPITQFAERSRATIDEFTRLETGWDGYDGVAVLPDIARHALCLLEAIGRHTTFEPDVVPLANGGLQLEWYVGVHEIEVEIAPDCAICLHHERTDDGKVDEFPIDSPHGNAELSRLFQALHR